MLVNGENVDSVKGKVNEFSENVETVKEILRRFSGDDSLEIVEMQCEAGSKDGDNYMSLIKRIKAKINTKNCSGECRLVKELKSNRVFLLEHDEDFCLKLKVKVSACGVQLIELLCMS